MKTKTNKTYRGKRTSKVTQVIYWRIVISSFFVAVIFLGLMGEHYTNVYPALAETAVHSPSVQIDTSVLTVLDGTAMEDAKPYIIKASAYYNVPLELYLGIASAESSFNRFRCYNPWGIDTGRGNDPRCYNNWEHSVNGFSQLIRYYYLDEGLVSASALVRKYVGWINEDWVANVSKYYQGTCS